MSAIPCPACGVLRKVEQIAAPEGWVNPACWNCGDPGWVQPDDADDPLAGRPAREALYRVWWELDPPLSRWFWWLTCHHLTWPTPGMWLGKAEKGVQQEAARRGATLVGDPLGEAIVRDGRVVIRASGIATAPFDPDAPVDSAPEGIDGGDR